MNNFKQICGLANRIELAAQFAISTTDAGAMDRTISDAFLSACSALDLTDPVWLRDVYTEATTLYTSSESPELKQEFHATFSDLMQQMGVQQKAIARLGTSVAGWDSKPTSFTELADALDNTGVIVEGGGDQFANTPNSENQSHPLFELANVFYGLALVVVALQPDQQENCWAPTIANSSARLLVQAANQLPS